MLLTRPGRVDLGTAATRFAGRVRPGVATTWTLQVRDRTGNAASSSVTRTAELLSENTTERAGAWQTLRDRAYLGGSALRSTARDASMTWRFTGRAVALGATRTSSSGRVRIYVDGADAGVLDLRSAAIEHRRAAWSQYFGASGRHTVRVVVEGSTGRPGVILDSLAVLR